VLKKFDAGR
jgi:hypothetical protein